MNGAHAPEITKKTSKYASLLPAVPVMPPPPKEVCTYVHMCHTSHTHTYMCAQWCVCVWGGGGGGLLYTKCSYIIALELWKICAQLSLSVHLLCLVLNVIESISAARLPPLGQVVRVSTYQGA